MITALIISLVGAILYLFFRKGGSAGRRSSTDSKSRIYIILLIGVLTLLAIFSPRVQERIDTLKRRLKL